MASKITGIRATGEVQRRSISQDNRSTVYGLNSQARIADPDDSCRVSSWLIEETHDARGNVIRYQYQKENTAGIDETSLHECNRLRNRNAFANGYLKLIRYGNRVQDPDPADDTDWMFDVVFDYGDHTGDAPGVQPDGTCKLRADPFSTCRSGFDLRTYRRCRRILMC